MVLGESHGVLAEALVSWVSLFGVIVSLRVYTRHTAPSRLERCVMFLLVCLGALLLVRGFFWMTGARAFGILTFAIAALVPLAVVLYVETLLRRHLPFAAKVLVLAGTVGFLGLALAGRLHADPLWLPVFSGYVLLLMLVLTGTLAFRDRADLTAIEGRAADAIAVAVVLIVPFVMTDLATDLGLHTVRVGSVGILMFVHAIVIASEPRGSAKTVLAGNLSVIAIAGVLGAIQAYVMGDLRAATVARSGAFFACVLLLILIYLRVHAQRQIARGPGLVRTISAADTRTTETFLQVLERLPIVATYRLMRAPDLGEYDHWCFPKLFLSDGARVVNRRQLRREPGAPGGEGRYHAEQLADLLEREGMTHAVLIRECPIALLLVHVPTAGLEQSAIAQLGLVCTVAEVIERGRGDA